MKLKKRLKDEHQLLKKMKGPIEMRHVVKECLMYKYSDVALATLYMLLDPKRYVPKKDENFENWQCPMTELEFDHSGAFRRLPMDYLMKMQSQNTRILVATPVKSSTDKHSASGCCPANSTSNYAGWCDNEYGLWARMSIFYEGVLYHQRSCPTNASQRNQIIVPGHHHEEF